MIRKPNKLSVLLGAVSIFCLFTTLHAAPIQELVFLNWSDYLSPTLAKKFEDQFNAKIRQVFFDGDDHRDELLFTTDGGNFDVALIDGATIVSYNRRGWLEKLSEKEMPNNKHIIPKWGEAYEDTKEYAVPYFWGTVGVAYRSDLIESSLSSWKDILEPPEELQGNIFMLPQNKELINIGLKALGYSLNESSDHNAYKQVKELLLKQRPYVKRYAVPAVNESSVILKGEVLAVVTYNGDALVLQEMNENISYFVPNEGSILWVDYLAVMAKSKNKKLAMDFINFLNDPQNAAEHSEYMYYATPNAAAEKLLSKELLANPLVYPDDAIIKKCEIEKKLPPRIIKKRNAIFAEITRGKM
jgi:spermidine/putrescine transport system substrate-binding protein